MSCQPIIFYSESAPSRWRENEASCRLCVVSPHDMSNMSHMTHNSGILLTTAISLAYKGGFSATHTALSSSTM